VSSNSQLPEDKLLIEKLLKKDEESFTMLIKAYHGIMKDVARAIVGDSIAEEVVQESWISIMRALPGFEGRSSLKTWIMRIVSNTAKTRLRKESRSIAAGDLLSDDNPILLAERFNAKGQWSNPPRSWSIDTPEALLASEQLRHTINQAIDSLPQMQKAVFMLHDRQGVDMNEICKILDVSESNSRVLLHRARTSLHTAIDEAQGN
jgi:RNA polymerase sigma-70 factor (ECF subfamily)